jgi:putative solute:sodium symporter small subunit
MPPHSPPTDVDFWPQRVSVQQIFAGSHNDFERSFMKDDNSQAYWKATIKLLTNILIVWFVVSFGAGILFAEQLNNFKLGGYPVGFWFAQQGSIYIFIVQIFYYAKRMNEIDREFNVHEE